MALLEQHPEVVVFRPFEYEPRVARYWAEVFGTLCEPGSYRQALGAVEEYDPEWWTGKRHQLPPITLEDPEIEQWIGGHGVEALARMCRGRIDAFYEHAAKMSGKQQPRYFAEKTLPETFSLHILPEFYQRTKHVFLVRDFRDMACSILAFDQQAAASRASAAVRAPPTRSTCATSAETRTCWWRAGSEPPDRPSCCATRT